MDLGDPGSASDPLGLFCGRLKRLQAQSGIKQAGLLGAVGVKRSQISDILNGKIERPPDWGVTIAIVRACLEHAKATSRLVAPDLSDEAGWQRRYFDLEQDLDTGARAKPRREEPAGRLLAEVTDPFALEVHHPVQPDGPPASLSTLPAYMPREHDRQLTDAVRAAIGGTSGIAVLVGGSSTGKTRACWEALEQLRQQPEQWRLWHPIDPSRPEAALRELPSIGPRTVIWLNEAQLYLDASAGGLGERVAAGLRELLRDPDRAPVLVLATLWPQFWAALTGRPVAGDDAHAQARELLAARDIGVPAAFSADQLRQLQASADPRLAQAASTSEGGQVIQFLAGAPELMARYRNAPPTAAALIDAAMDARRLGMGVALPLAFLEASAPGYLTDNEWDGVGEDWLEQGLAYTAAPCNGIRGPLVRIRPRPGADPDRGPAYRLADYLDQHGRRARRACIPPASFWDAAAGLVAPASLPTLAEAAADRGLLRDAARLRKQATTQGDVEAATALVKRWHFLPGHPTDPRPAQWAAAHAALDDPDGVAQLLGALREAGADQQVAALLARDPAAHAALDNPGDVAWLLDALREAGADQQVAALLARATADAALDNPHDVAWLLDALREAGADQQVAALLARDPAAHAALDNPADVAWLLDALRKAAARQQTRALAVRATAHAALDDPVGVAVLLDALREAGADQQVAALLARDPVAHAALDNPVGVAVLLDALREAGADQQVAALLARDPAAHAALDNPGGVARLLLSLGKAGVEHQALAAALAALDDPDGVAVLLDALREAGADQQVAALLARDPAAHVALDNPARVAWLLRALRKADADQQVAALLARDPAAHAALDNPLDVAVLLRALREAGAEQQARALAARATPHTALDDPIDVGWLLDALREAGADQQVAALLARDPAAHVALDNPARVAWLLRALRKADAEQQAGMLVDRLPAEGQFDLFCEQPGYEVLYRFGRTPDGRPALPWGWEDLD